MIFQRSQKALLWSKGLRDRQCSVIVAIYQLQQPEVTLVKVTNIEVIEGFKIVAVSITLTMHMVGLQSVIVAFPIS